MDVSMPGMNGVEATELIHAALPRIAVIGLSMHLESDMAEKMRQAGAVDYVAKNAPPEALVQAIRKARETGRA